MSARSHSRRLSVRILGLVLSVSACESSLAGFEVDTSTDLPSVSYNGVEVISAVELYFTRPGAWKKAHQLDARKLRVVRSGKTSRITHSGKVNGIGTYEWNMQWEENRLHIRVRYELEPNAKTGHVINEVFLSWPLVKSARHTGPKGARQQNEFGTFGPVEQISFETYIGRLDWKFATRIERPNTRRPLSNWRLRDTRTHQYRPKRCRSYSFISAVNFNKAQDARERGLIQQLDVTLEVTPRRHFDAALMANGLLQALDDAAKRWPKTASMLESDPGWRNIRKRLKAVVEGTVAGSGEKSVPRLVADAAQRTEALLKKRLADVAREKDGVFVIPKPQKMVRERGSFALDSEVVILLPRTVQKEELRGPTVLVEELEDYFGVTIKAAHGDTLPAGKRCIIIGRAGQTALIRRICRQEGIEVDARRPGPEGYVLHVSPNRVVIVGSDDRGSFYGVQSLLQLLRRDRDGRIIAPCVKIVDWPEMKARGMMMMAGKHGPSAQKRAIRRVIARHKLNYLLYALGWGDIKWRSHPELARERAWSTETLRECVDFAKEHFLEVIPYMQTAGHSGWIVQKRPDLREAWSSLCLSNPEVFKLVTDICAEAIEICRPKVFHIACDEVAQVGVCDRCKDTPADELYAGHVTRLHDWLAERGIKTMMWHDMLLEAKRWPNSSAHSAMQPQGGYSAATHPAAEKLPRDIIMGVWIYGEHRDFPALRHFQELGFPVAACPWYKAKNNCYFALRAHEAGAWGVVGTTWMFNSHQELSMMSALTAEYSWTPGTPKLAELPYVSVERVQDGMFAPRPSMRGNPSEIVNIRPWCNRSLRDEKANDGRGWADRGPLHDMRLLPEGKNRFGNVVFEIIPYAGSNGRQCIAVGGKDIRRTGIPTQVSNIKINDTAESFVFLHTCSLDTYIYNKVLAEYVVHYADGTEKIVPVRTYRNIISSRKPQDYSRPHYEARNSGYILNASRAWVGMNLAGEEIDVQAYEWVNPSPEKEIAGVDLRMLCHKRGASVFLLGLTAVRSK